jgi:ABC-type bacteriocin/lantibiotic exporter with double-glycine peptidase domain
MKLGTALRIAVIALLSAALMSAADTPGLWIDVPYIAQVKDGCGSAVISMVMQYWARQEDEPAPAASDAQTIQQILFAPSEKGIPASAMLQYFQRNGYRALAFSGEWSDLREQIAKGRPLIVSLKASGPHGPLHYAIVAGVDSEREFVFLDDPARGKMLRFSREAFLQEWNPAGRWVLLALPASN